MRQILRWVELGVRWICESTNPYSIQPPRKKWLYAWLNLSTQKIDKVGLDFVNFYELMTWLHIPTFGKKIKITQSLNGVIYNLEWRIKYHSLGINFNTLIFHPTNLRRIWHLSICCQPKKVANCPCVIGLG